jgi:hypothetical protein
MVEPTLHLHLNEAVFVLVTGIVRCVHQFDVFCGQGHGRCRTVQNMTGDVSSILAARQHPILVIKCARVGPDPRCVQTVDFSIVIVSTFLNIV